MFECRYCGNVFEKCTTVGACPSCGGPKPNKLKQEIQEIIVEKYFYIQTTPRLSSYYTPPEPTFTQRMYGTFGYKAVISGVSVTAILLAIWFLYFWFFYRSGAPKDIDPKYQNIIPTAAATVTPYQNNSPWQNTLWLSSEEALALRTQENAINLAYLDRGGAKYTTIGIIFNAESWQKAKPLGVTEKTPDGTSVKLKINGYEYYLNSFQPFVIKGQENTLYLVDSTGQIWKADLANTPLIDLETAQGSLPIVISPNPRLSPTH